MALAWVLVWSALGYLSYRAITRDIASLQTLRGAPSSSITAAQLDGAAGRLADLATQLGRLDRAATFLLGGPSLGGHLPWLGPRYLAALHLIEAGEQFSAAGADGARIGRDTLTAFNGSGVLANPGKPGPTWLQVLAGHNSDIQRDARLFARGEALRAQVDPALLPANVRPKLQQVDQSLARADVPAMVNRDLPALETALGADGPRRYLVLFQDSNELRPSGGFPGTMALVEVRNGQVGAYRFFSAHQLSDDYLRQRAAPLPQPYPIQTYFPQAEFILHDATWFDDFPRGASQLMAMYGETNWPEIGGVVAVDPTIVSDIMRVTGPIPYTFEGETRVATADNVTDEIERIRKLAVEGIVPRSLDDEPHKEVLALIGQGIIERLKAADRSQLLAVGKDLLHAANRRDVQLYDPEQRIEAAIDAHRWSGAIAPDPAKPTVALTFANVALGKSSPRMHPHMTVQVEPDASGRQLVTVSVELEHTGTNQENPVYAGFQRWWIAAHLPPGSALVTSSQAPEPDPESPNGGSYQIPLFPQQRVRLTLMFTMPASEQLVLRRQPGLYPETVVARVAGCDGEMSGTLTTDLTLSLAQCRLAPGN